MSMDILGLDFAEFIASTPGGSRTPNPQLRRLMLYPVELRVRQQPERNRDDVYRVELRVRNLS